MRKTMCAVVNFNYFMINQNAPRLLSADDVKLALKHVQAWLQKVLIRLSLISPICNPVHDAIRFEGFHAENAGLFLQVRRQVCIASCVFCVTFALLQNARSIEREEGREYAIDYRQTSDCRRSQVCSRLCFAFVHIPLSGTIRSSSSCWTQCSDN